VTKGQLLWISLCLGLLAGLFFFGNTVEKKEIGPLEKVVSTDTGEDFSFTDYNLLHKKSLFPDQLSVIDGLEKKLASSKVDSEKLDFLEKLATSWEKYGKFALASEYWSQISAISNSAGDWNRTGRKYFTALKSGEDTSITNYLTDKTYTSLEKATELDNETVRYKVDLAESKIELSPNAMEGVLILLDVEKEAPDDLRTNLLLGRMGIVSGQFDKAKIRLERVLKKAPENTEALYYLAGAYSGLGDNKKAIEILNKTRALIDNPSFRKEIDAYIKTLK